MKFKLLKSLLVIISTLFFTCTQSQTNNATWSKLSTNSPSMKAENAMVYDLSNKKIINYGGRTGFPDFNRVNETWVFDYEKQLWINMSPTSSPPWRSSHAMTYDILRHRTLLFGGNNFSNAFNDLWSYNYKKNTWTQHNTSNTPEARQMHGMVYILDKDIVIMFGGRKTNGGASFADTWELNCKTMTWKKLNPKQNPPISDHINITYDEFSKKVILYANSETWAYSFDSENWTQIELSNSPNSDHSNLVYNTVLKKSILFGDSKNTNKMQTWMFGYHKNKWTNISPNRFPKIDFYVHKFIEHASMVYMKDQNVCIQYGGCCSNQTLELKFHK